MWSNPQLGFGVGLRNVHYGELLEHGTQGVAWFEIISENFFEPGGRPWVVLERVRREVPVVMHGVSLAIGNTDPLSPTYLESLRALAERVEPAWVSDHLCWGGFGGVHSHDLLPLPYTEESLDHVVRRVHQVQEHLRRPLMLENVSSYVTFASSVLEEWDFLNEVAGRTGAGLLLDVNNVFVSAKNHGFSAERYIDAIRAEHVGQVHLAGHTDHGDYLLDTHVGPVPEGVLALYERAITRFGVVPTLVEWDEHIPPFEELRHEALRAEERAGRVRKESPREPVGRASRTELAQ